MQELLRSAYLVGRQHPDDLTGKAHVHFPVDMFTLISTAPFIAPFEVWKRSD